MAFAKPHGRSNAPSGDAHSIGAGGTAAGITH